MRGLSVVAPAAGVEGEDGDVFWAGVCPSAKEGAKAKVQRATKASTRDFMDSVGAEYLFSGGSRQARAFRSVLAKKPQVTGSQRVDCARKRSIWAVNSGVESRKATPAPRCGTEYTMRPIVWNEPELS